MKLEKDKKLLEYNFYRINAEAELFTELKNKKDFLDLPSLIKENKIKKYFILGGGANTIFVSPKYKGLVIRVSNNFSKWENNFRVEVGAGKDWDNFLGALQKKGEREKRNNFFEIQSLSAIPGSVGAAAVGNIGAFGTEVKKYIYGAWIFNIKKGNFVFLNNEELKFSYRNSFLKENREKYIVYSVVFDFSPSFQKKMKERYSEGEYFSLAHFAKKHNLGRIKKSEIRNNIKKLRHSVYPDLKKFPNVGSTFKNTEVNKKQLKEILKDYPDMPSWELDNGKIKIPTAYIFDKVLNLKGRVFGHIKIDEKRPLFFTNLGGATGKEFYNLCQKIKKMTKKELGVDIEEEVVYAK